MTRRQLRIPPESYLPNNKRNTVKAPFCITFHCIPQNVNACFMVSWPFRCRLQGPKRPVGYGSTLGNPPTAPDAPNFHSENHNNSGSKSNSSNSDKKNKNKNKGSRHSSNVWWTCFNRIYSMMLVFFTSLGHSPLKECIVFWRVFNSHFKSACSTSPNPPVKEWERLASWPSRTDRENYATFR